MEAQFSLNDWMLLFRKNGYSFPKDTEIDLMKDERCHQKRLEYILRLLRGIDNEPLFFRIIHREFFYGVMTIFGVTFFALFVYITKNNLSTLWSDSITYISTLWVALFAILKIHTEAKKREDIEKYGGLKILNPMVDLCFVGDEKIAEHCSNLGFLFDRLKEIGDKNCDETLISNQKKKYTRLSVELELHKEIQKNLKGLTLAISNYLKDNKKKILFKDMRI